MNLQVLLYMEKLDIRSARIAIKTVPLHNAMLSKERASLGIDVQAFNVMKMRWNKRSGANYFKILRSKGIPLLRLSQSDGEDGRRR